jgi:hypothetical protein
VASVLQKRTYAEMFNVLTGTSRASAAKPQSKLAAADGNLRLPLLWLAVVIAIAALLLSVPLRAPIGPMYWDVFTYYDAANRIFSGQIPSRDFFTPAGPLGYGIAAAWIAVFPNGQPSLLVHWSIMTLTVPLMAGTVLSLPVESRKFAIWLVLPFLFFSLLPFNGKEFYPFPGSDAFGLYNRHVCLLLFPLVSALIFMRKPGPMVALITLSMLALFFVKITGFAAAGILCAFALLTGRVRPREALISGALFLAALAALEASTGLVFAYLRDVALLAEMNSGTLLPRLFQSLSINFGVTAALGALALAVLYADQTSLRASLAAAFRERSFAAIATLLDHPAFWLTAVMLAGILFETQNTGSQAMIFAWPVLLLILTRPPEWYRSPRMAIVIAALAGAAYLPLIVGGVERTARAFIGSVAGDTVLEHANLKTLGAVTMRPLVLKRSDAMMASYVKDRLAFESIAASGELPSNILYSEYDFQITFLRSVDQAISSIRALENKHDIRFETILSLNFTNPFPYLMDRQAPLHLTVGADPFRAVPPAGSSELAAVAAADLVLFPTCPVTTSNLALTQIYARGLEKHSRIKLDDCFDAFVHPDIAVRMTR